LVGCLDRGLADEGFERGHISGCDESIFKVHRVAGCIKGARGGTSVTDNVFLGSPVSFCCAQGFHTAGMSLGLGYGQTSGQGDQPLPTWIYSAYIRPGAFDLASLAAVTISWAT